MKKLLEDLLRSKSFAVWRSLFSKRVVLIRLSVSDRGTVSLRGIRASASRHPALSINSDVKVVLRTLTRTFLLG